MAQTFEQAKSNLSQRFRIVGSAEQFDISPLLFRQIFNWQDIRYYRQNVTKTSRNDWQLTAEDREGIGAIIREIQTNDAKQFLALSQQLDKETKFKLIDIDQ